MNIDSRGRIRFTHGHVRYEINHKGELRTYQRDAQFAGSERSTQPVPVDRLGLDGSVMMLRAIRTHRNR